MATMHRPTDAVPIPPATTAPSAAPPRHTMRHLDEDGVMRHMSRRGLLGGMATVALGVVVGSGTPIGGVAAAAAGPMARSARSVGSAVGAYPDPGLDTSHATPEVARLVTALYRDKTARDIDLLMTHFSQDQLVYSDATVGVRFEGWAAMKTFFTSFLPRGKTAAVSYPTRIIGDEHSAMVLFTDSPQYFGGEVRIIASIDLRGGKVIREVDYWDGRHFGSVLTDKLRSPIGRWPATYGEDLVRDQSSPVLRRVVGALHDAFSKGDAAAATALFTSDAIFEDLTLHLRLVGPLAIGGFLTRALSALPYGRGTAVRHTVGSAQGGGYEWLNKGAHVAHPPTVWQGNIAIELDRHGKVSRFTSVWDGTLMNDTTLTTLLVATIEH